MAETLGTVTGARKQSIARVELFTDAVRAQDDWELVIHFEDGTYDSQGALLPPTAFGTRVVRRRFGDIKKDVIPGTQVTVAQLAGMISAAAYVYRAADIAKK